MSLASTFYIIRAGSALYTAKHRNGSDRAVVRIGFSYKSKYTFLVLKVYLQRSGFDYDNLFFQNVFFAYNQ